MAAALHFEPVIKSTDLQLQLHHNSKPPSPANISIPVSAAMDTPTSLPPTSTNLTIHFITMIHFQSTVHTQAEQSISELISAPKNRQSQPPASKQSTTTMKPSPFHLIISNLPSSPQFHQNSQSKSPQLNRELCTQTTT
jgi:hypothetical protein